MRQGSCSECARHLPKAPASKARGVARDSYAHRPFTPGMRKTPGENAPLPLATVGLAPAHGLGQQLHHVLSVGTHGEVHG